MTLYGIVRRYQEGCTADALAEEFPSLLPAVIQEVLTFYLANQNEIDAYVEACRQAIERQAKGLGKLPLPRSASSWMSCCAARESFAGSGGRPPATRVPC